MHRNNLFKKLNLYSPQDSNELTMYNSLLQFIDKTPDCFNSKLDTGHITGSAWILDYKKNSVLLTHHKKLNKWLQLGGHADGDSDILSVAEREAEEGGEGGGERCPKGRVRGGGRGSAAAR